MSMNEFITSASNCQYAPELTDADQFPIVDIRFHRSSSCPSCAPFQKTTCNIFGWHKEDGSMDCYVPGKAVLMFSCFTYSFVEPMTLLNLLPNGRIRYYAIIDEKIASSDVPHRTNCLRDFEDAYLPTWKLYFTNQVKVAVMAFMILYKRKEGMFASLCKDTSSLIVCLLWKSQSDLCWLPLFTESLCKRRRFV